MEQKIKTLQMASFPELINETQNLTNQMNEDGFELTVFDATRLDNIAFVYEAILIFTKR